MKETKSKSRVKAILFIIGIIAILGIIIAIISNNIAKQEEIKKETFKKVLNESVSQELAIFHYFDYETEEKKDNGYIIYKSGLIRQFDEINSTINDVRTISEEDINEILQLISKIDEKQNMTWYR